MFFHTVISNNAKKKKKNSAYNVQAHDLFYSECLLQEIMQRVCYQTDVNIYTKMLIHFWNSTEVNIFLGTHLPWKNDILCSKSTNF